MSSSSTATAVVPSALRDLYLGWSELMATHELDMRLFRSIFDEWHQPTIEPENVTYKEETVGGVPGIWAFPAGADRSKVLLYTHGGGFAVGSAASHRKLAAHVAKAAGVTAFVLDYRRAPEHPHPAQVDDGVAAFEALRQAPDRDLLGEAQRRWVGETLSRSKAAGRPWQIIGNQVIMARVKGPDITRMMPAEQVQQMVASLPADVRPQIEAAIQLFKLGLPFNLDSWDGYPAGRERLYETFANAGLSPVVLAGDSHAFWVNELYDNAGARRAVEFGTSSISSP